MSRTALEKITASLVVILTTVLSLGAILLIANAIFSWDIFPPFAEKILYFIGASCLVLIVASTLINIMLNISRLADYTGELLKERTVRTKK